MNKEEKELIENCKIWIDEEDINYTRWFGLNELAILIKLIEKLRIKNGKEFVRGMKTEHELWRAIISSKIEDLYKGYEIHKNQTIKDIIQKEIQCLESLLGE